MESAGAHLFRWKTMQSAMDEPGRTVFTEDMTIGIAPMQCLSSAGARAAESVAQPYALHTPTPYPMLVCGGARALVSTLANCSGSRAYATLSCIRSRDRNGKPQRFQRAQRAVTRAGPDGVLEEDGHGQHACEPAPAPLL